MRARNHRTGFTLIELMIVVAIIAVLISILLPSLARARQQAMQVACAANLNAIHKGMFYYSEDRQNGNGYLPQLGSWIVSDHGFGYWTDQISKYVKIKRTRAGSRNGLTICPAHEAPELRHVTGYLAGAEATLAEKVRCDSEQGAGTGGRDRSRGGFLSRACHVEPVSYTGCCDTLELTTRSGLFPMKWSQIDRPHCFIMLTEASQRSGRAARCFNMVDLVAEARDNPDQKRHYGGQSAFSNGSNYMFADGHTQWHSAEFTATKLVCCMEFGVSGSAPAIRSLKNANCDGPAASDPIARDGAWRR